MRFPRNFLTLISKDWRNMKKTTTPKGQENTPVLETPVMPCRKYIKSNVTEKGRSCTECKVWKSKEAFHSNRGHPYNINPTCKECRKPRSKRDYHKQTREQKLFDRAKSRATRKGQEFNIVLGDIYIQDVCPVLNMPYIKTGQYVPSLDRIDNNKGYTKENIIVMSSRANRMKGDFNIEELNKLIRFLLVIGVIGVAYEKRQCEV